MHRRRLILSGSLVTALLATTTACACLWDSDTLQMERLRFPGVPEIITGKFVRHSQAYYEWRIKDRLKKLETTPNDPALIDDLAVGYDKLGRYDEGITVLEKSLAADPDRYETLANLATLLFHAGRLEESKQHVQRALEINPNAHFGREKYQLLLTEYVQQEDKENSFATFVIEARFGPQEFETGLSNWPAEWKDEVRSATRGVMGMLHFADFKSPVLLEALGDLLFAGEAEENATQLAARCYLRAAEGTEDSEQVKKLRENARMILTFTEQVQSTHGEVDFSSLEQQLAKEVAEGSSWFAAIEGNERKWITEGRDVDWEFAAAYYVSLDRTIGDAEKQLQTEPKQIRLSQRQREIRLIVTAGLICVGLPVATVVLSAIATVLWLRRRRSQSETPGKPAMS